MSQTLTALGIDRLSVAQRILFVEEIRDSIATEAEQCLSRKRNSKISSSALRP